jgi:AbrB family looped-hinge helix DNA binding protein
MIRSSLEALGEAKPSRVISWIEDKYGKINRESIRADLIGFAGNHSSTHHSPGSNKFLWFNSGNKSYRLANQDEIARFREKQEMKRKPRVQVPIEDEAFASKLSSSGQVVIPARLREEMGLRTGDLIGFEKTDRGWLIRKAKKKLEYLE